MSATPDERSRAHVEFRMRLVMNEALAVGPGKIALLEAIEEVGSIAAAARQHRMSYRRAWTLIDELNRCFVAPLVETSTGGRAGGGAQLTTLGREVARTYRMAEAAALAASQNHLSALLAHAS